jgi:hypothetical protein
MNLFLINSIAVIFVIGASGTVVLAGEVTGTMVVDIENAKSITGRGTLKSDNSQVYFDYFGKPYPSSIDWKKATTLTFTPDKGKKKSYHKSDVEYFFNGGWVGPRLVLSR